MKRMSTRGLEGLLWALLVLAGAGLILASSTGCNCTVLLGCENVAVVTNQDDELSPTMAGAMTAGMALAVP